MATAIDVSVGKVRRPELSNKIDAEANINDALLLTSDDGLITALDDRTLRIWLKRQTGKYWPSVCQNLESSPTVLAYHEASYRLFCGCDSGQILEFLVAEDFNKVALQTTYYGHQSRVNALHFSSRHDLLFSVCREKKLNWYSTNSADDNYHHPRGNFNLSSWGMSITFDDSARHCFVGDASGTIHFLKIDTNLKYQLVTTLKGHTGAVQNLIWQNDVEWLYSGSFDKSIVVWDVGAQQGLAVELNGHLDRLVGLSYDRSRRLLITCSADGRIGVWPMNVKRSETPKWLESDSCQICHLPFFWNVREMWSKKQIGLRQHHCRKCGRAICDKCSQTRKALPLLGYEIAQRICDDCLKTLSNEETTPLASFYDTRLAVTRMDYSEAKKTMITVGTDRSVKIWDMSSVI